MSGLRCTLRGSDCHNDSSPHEQASNPTRVRIPVLIADVHLFRGDPGSTGTRAGGALRLRWNRELRRHSRRSLRVFESSLRDLSGRDTRVHFLVHAGVSAFKVSKFGKD